MTEEEMAEEYANKQHTHIILQWEKIKQAYLAGLHEGQPKWHDLRKDPNDLPLCNESGISTIKMTDKGEWATYLSYRKEWYTKQSIKIEVFQWCDFEIPQFDSEE